MDLAKIIAEMKVELQCLDTAIASIEELARVQNVPLPGEIRGAPAETGAPVPASEETAPVKRSRGRPRKTQPGGEGTAVQPTDSEPTQADDGSTFSAA
jgi:hypothetical protein